MPETNARIKVCHDTAANFKTNNPTLLVGEWALETDTKKMKIGDGSTAYNSLPYSTAEDSDEWRKPEDWVDIRSGAIGDSIYLLVAHSTPTESEGTYTVETYPQFHLLAQVSTSGNTYDVFVDGVKVATTATNTKTVLDWATLYGAGTVSTIYTTTHPSSLVYHIVRITPTVSTDTLTRFRNDADASNVQQGVLWAHFELSNAIRIVSCLGGEVRPRNLLLEAVTAKDNKIIYAVHSTGSNSGYYGAFAYCSSLVQIPVLEAENTTYASGGYLAFREVRAKKVVIRKNKGTEDFLLLNNTKVQEFDVENGLRLHSGTASANNASGPINLKKFPSLSKTQDGTSFAGTNFTSLQDTFIDLSSNTSLTLFRLFGSSTATARGLKGLIVSTSAPFDGASPQINVSYTGMNRAALVNLFKSIPYNVGYNVVGTPTIVDGVVSGFSGDDYLKLSTNFRNTWNSEIVISLKTPSSTYLGLSQYINIMYGVVQVYCYSNTSAFTNVGVNINGFGDLSFGITGGMQPSTHYKLKFVNDGTNCYTYYAVGDNDFVLGDSKSASTISSASGILRLGSRNATQNLKDGEINLNETYIKVDGQVWFGGTSAMTKTCSVVGCTGTADLTADDKAIATGKGWELTVA